jgi:hypothetical protein
MACLFFEIRPREFQRVKQSGGGSELNVAVGVLSLHTVNDGRKNFVGLFLQALGVHVLADVADCLQGGLPAHLRARGVGDVGHEQLQQLGPHASGQLHDGHVLHALRRCRRTVAFRSESSQDVALDIGAGLGGHGQPSLRDLRS